MPKFEPEVDGAGATAAALVNQHVGNRGEPVHAVHLLYANTRGFLALSLEDFVCSITCFFLLFNHLFFYCSITCFFTVQNLFLR